MKLSRISALAIACGILALVSTRPVSAQSAPTSRECYHVAYASQGVIPATAMRWNSCTGETWLLLSAPLYDQKGARTGSFWGWFPVAISKDIATSPN